MNRFLKTSDIDLTMYQKHMDNLRHRLLGPSSQIPIQQAWRGTREHAFLSSSWVMLRLLVQGPHLESHWPNLFFLIAMDCYME